jgi:hypothetical protein
MQPNRYTELFFLDEATALAAGHRPCFECRRAAAERFAELWACTQGRARRERAPAMDEVLHAERVDGERRKVTYRARRGDIPSGAFVRYARDVEVLTPRSIVAVLSAGYRPMLHPTAAALLG